jgi:hypothetical protein
VENAPDVAGSTASPKCPELDMGVDIVASRRGLEEVDRLHDWGGDGTQQKEDERNHYLSAWSLTGMNQVTSKKPNDSVND